MKFDAQFFSSPTGQLVAVGVLAAIAVGAVAWQRSRGTAAMPLPKAVAPASLPKVFERPVVRFDPPAPTPVPQSAATAGTTAVETPPAVPKLPPLALFTAPVATVLDDGLPVAPYGRLIPCETVVTLESNRLETPVIGLVTADVWHDGVRVIPAGAEVHGRASLDRTRERIAVEGRWTIVWRTADRSNGRELRVSGIALDRESGESGTWGERDGSAGLRGEVLRTDDWREAKLFAATFLSTATSALQDTRASAGLLGETAVPAATARNATLAGTSALLREYAEQLREAVTRDGFYVRVPAGKAFYLYVTQTLGASAVPPSTGLAPAQP